MEQKCLEVVQGNLDREGDTSLVEGHRKAFLGMEPDLHVPNWLVEVGRMEMGTEGYVDQKGVEHLEVSGHGEGEHADLESGLGEERGPGLVLVVEPDSQ